MATEFKLPEVGEGITSGTVVEVPSTVAGVVQEIRVNANEEASVGQVVLVVGDGDAPAAAPSETQTGAPAETQAETAPAGDGTEEARPSAGAADAAAEEMPAEETRAGDQPGTDEKEAEIAAAANAGDAGAAQTSSDSYDTPIDEKQPIPAAPSVRPGQLELARPAAFRLGRTL